MKLAKKLSVFLLAAVAAFAFTACGESGADFNGITLQDAVFVYDGAPHGVYVQGELPENANVSYAGNDRTEAGEYEVTATISGEGYRTKKLSAKMTIEQAEFPADVSLESKRVLYDGKPHSLEITGNIPENTNVSYAGNDRTEAGSYEVTATLTNVNYRTKTYTAELVVYTIAEAAANVLSRVLDRPQPWSFLPEAFAPENMAYETMPAGGDDFSALTPISAIAAKPIGRQLNVLYDGLSQTNALLSAANAIFTAGEAIAAVYQNFIDSNPDDYDVFTGSVTIAGVEFKIKITTDGEKTVLLAGSGGVSIELVSDRSENAQFCNEGRIELASGIALRYRMSDGALELGIKFTVSGAGVLQKISFARSGDVVSGYLYEYCGAESAAIKTSALVYSDSEITAVVSDKRESDDLAIDAYAEVYDSATGEMYGGEVTETVKLTDYDTLWFNLYDVNGFESVRVTEEENAENSLNAHSVYLNGSETPLVPEFNKILLLKTSRRYDVEMKTVWYYIKTAENGEITYEKRETEIPMLFVQKENTDDFAKEISANNACIVNAYLPEGKKSIITECFSGMSETYREIKESVTFGEIVAFIGERDPYFG